MVMLASAAGSILANCYYLRNPIDSWNLFPPADRPANTREAVERLILGILKAAAAFSIYSALYIANARLEGWGQKGAALACAFCIYPLAALDFPLMQGIFEVYHSTFVMHAKDAMEVKKIVNIIEEQAKNEGLQFYNSWGQCPPETRQRCLELIDIAKKDNPEVKKILEGLKLTIPQAWGLLMQGLKRLGISGVAEVVVVNLPTYFPQLFWLDRHMVNASTWLASRFV
jgi:hypothetical protein